MGRGILAFCILIAGTISSFAQEDEHGYSQQEILDDLTYLYQTLEAAHYDLYAYTPKEEYDRFYESLKASLHQPSYSLLEAYNIFQPLVSQANNGHTEIDFPVAPYLSYAQNGGVVFPLEVAFQKGVPLIRRNFSQQKNINIGDEILSINGVKIEDVLAKIYPQISAERLYFKQAKLELLTLPRYYWRVFGRVDEFQVEVKQQNHVSTYSVKAVDVFDGFERVRKDILQNQKILKFFAETTYLNPGNFSGDLAEFQEFINQSFLTIGQNKPKNLIIDLRNNGGGDDAFSDYMVSFIADKPFQWNGGFSLKSSQILKDHTREKGDIGSRYSVEILSRDNGEVYDFTFPNYQPQPKEKRFQGEVYVLVNRQSHSQSTVTAAQMKDYGWAIIVGEETAEYPSLYASQFSFSLPKTGIAVKLSKGRIIRVAGTISQNGLKPDILMEDHLLDEVDEILDFLLKSLEN